MIRSPPRGLLRSHGSVAAGCLRLASQSAQRPWRPYPALARWQSVAVDPQKKRTTLAIPSIARKSEIGIQHISEHIYQQIFREKGDPPSPELVELAKDHLQRHELLGKNTDNAAPIAFELPELQGNTLDEHFHKLGVDAGRPYLEMATTFARQNLPPKPREWVRQSGWTQYCSGQLPVAVAAPLEETLVFDTEVLWKESSFAVMACAASPTAWYAWLSPWLLGESDNDCHLIPMGDPKVDRVVVGHNIGYDRARILEEYDIRQTRTAFLDTMSLHVAVNGMCSQQRPTWMRHRKNRELRERIAKETDDFELALLLEKSALEAEEAELWVERSSINSLRDVAQFHLDIAIDKSVRDDFGELDRTGICEKLDVLLDYCAADVAVTHRVFQIVFPNFIKVCPHPVSFAALRHLSSVILPVNRSWNAYVDNAERIYHELSNDVKKRLVTLAHDAVALRKDEDTWSQDPWLQQLDWSGQEIRIVKGKRKDDPPRPSKAQKMPGMPKWYKGLFVGKKKDGDKDEDDSERMNISVRTRLAPLLLRLSWDGHPLFWSTTYGWTFRVPNADAAQYERKQMLRCDMSEEESELLRNDMDNAYFKLPHKDGPSARCVSPMAKSYLTFFESGILSSEYAYAKEALEMNASCSYWISARERIKSQLVVYNSQLADANTNGKAGAAALAPDEGFILPQVIPMGTITRRAVENTWLTASNAKKNRVGSELKAMVKAPPGYSFVGADVDSEELWIASVVGDATFGLHGGNAIGFMTLEGTKAAGTDLHSRTASILGITRNNAKVFNYGRIYGAGLKFAAQLLRQFNPALSEAETLSIATKLYQATKGTRTARRALYDRPFWRGGTESFVFNKLEEFAEQEQPRTPVLGAGITEALMGRFISKGGYLTSRINWAIQSSGQDYLHLLIVAMDYLIRRFNIDARLAITVHDEIRYIVRDVDRYRTAMALQVANLWTRAMFAEQVGIRDLPQSCAFFSAVDIDHVLRKEVDMDCVTPSHPEAIAPGESLDVEALLARGEEAYLDPAVVPERAPQLEDIAYSPRKPVMQSLKEMDPSTGDLAFIRAQITADDQELREILAAKRRKVAEAMMVDSLVGAASKKAVKAVKKPAGKTVKRTAAKKAVETAKTAETADSGRPDTTATDEQTSMPDKTTTSIAKRTQRSVQPYCSSPHLMSQSETTSMAMGRRSSSSRSEQFLGVVDSSDDFQVFLREGSRGYASSSGRGGGSAKSHGRGNGNGSGNGGSGSGSGRKKSRGTLHRV